MQETALVETKKKLGRFYEVEEHIPDPGETVIGYSHTFKEYYLCSLSFSRGWRNTSGSLLCEITHWIPLPFSLPFESKDEQIK